MNIFGLCQTRKPQVVVPTTPNNTVIIRATSPEEAHLFRMIDKHGKCQEVDIRVVSRIAMQRIEKQRRERILSTFLQGMSDELEDK